MKSFAVTWDYRCPFARNAHEHLAAALAGGADWDVTFLPFSLSQAHVPEGGAPVWDDRPRRWTSWRSPPAWWCAISIPSSSSMRTCAVLGPPRRGT